MAQKQKEKARSKPKARSRGSTTKAKATKKATKSSTKATKSPKAKSSSNGAGRIDAARHTVEETAKDAGQTIGSAASKAKVPLLAGGAALAGAAGGLALGAHQAHRRGPGARMLSRRPQDMNRRNAAKPALSIERYACRKTLCAVRR